jgi:hypothetical protein
LRFESKNTECEQRDEILGRDQRDNEKFIFQEKEIKISVFEPRRLLRNTEGDRVLIIILLPESNC